MSGRPDGAASGEESARAARRARVRERLGPGGALVLCASPEPRAGSDTELRYLADSSLYYLSGCLQPETGLVLCGSAEQPAYTLFVPDRDPDRELWTGARAGVEEARVAYGADVAWPVTELAAKLPGLLEQTERVYYRLGASAELDRLLLGLLAAGRAQRPRTGRGLHTITDPGRALDELRLLKDETEIAHIRAACDVAVASFRELRHGLRPGAGEWEIEAALEAGFRRRGASGPAFPSIVGSGANATVLHYSANRSVVAAGEVVLADAGARTRMYCSDITRCYPASGQFTTDQRAVYDVVWRAHDAGIAAAVPGAPVSAIHDAALRALLQGMIELRLLAGDPDALSTQPDAYQRFYPHRTSHWLGLDVHDAGDYVVDGAPRVLRAGMVLTVEPGLYIPRAEATAPAGLRGTGIRLEDDVLITASGPEVLTAALPLDPAKLFD